MCLSNGGDIVFAYIGVHYFYNAPNLNGLLKSESLTLLDMYT